MTCADNRRRGGRINERRPFVTDATGGILGRLRQAPALPPFTRAISSASEFHRGGHCHSLKSAFPTSTARLIARAKLYFIIEIAVANGEFKHRFDETKKQRVGDASG